MYCKTKIFAIDNKNKNNIYILNIKSLHIFILKWGLLRNFNWMEKDNSEKI